MQRQMSDISMPQHPKASAGRQVVGQVKKVGKSRNFHQKVGKSRNFFAKKVGKSRISKHTFPNINEDKTLFLVCK